MLKMIFIGLGGAIGAIGRYWISGLVHTKYLGNFPLGTFVVNVSGAFVLGFLFVLFTEKTMFTPHIRTMITIGILGAFTTFSTFSVETINLIELSMLKMAVFNILFSVAAGLFFAWLGTIIARLI